MRLRHLTIAVAAALVSTNGFCMINAIKGFYLGGALGLIHYIQPPGSTVSTGSPNPLFRPSGGYRFNDYIALDAGYNDVVNESDGGNSIVGPNKLRIYTFDLACKLIRPYPNGWSLSAKAGLGYTRQYVLNVPIAGGPALASYSNNRLQALIGAGVSYNINKNLAADLNASYYFRSEQIGAMELLAAGITYTFDRWW